MRTSEKRLQRRDLRKVVYKKYEKKYTEDTFNVTLQRALNRLLVSGYLKKDNVGHQQVYYYIPKQLHKEIAENLCARIEKEAGKKLFDDYWNSLTPEQRKKLVETQKQQYDKAIQMIGRAFQRLVKNFESGVKDLAKQWISELEHPNEYVKHRYSAEQRQKFLEILRKEVDGTYKRFYEENCQNCVHLTLNDEQLIGRCRIYNCLPTGIELEEADPEIFTSGCKHLKKRKLEKKG